MCLKKHTVNLSLPHISSSMNEDAGTRTNMIKILYIIICFISLKVNNKKELKYKVKYLCVCYDVYSCLSTAVFASNVCT